MKIQVKSAFIIFMICLTFSCTKNSKEQKTEVIPEPDNIASNKTIDFENMKHIAYNADKLTPEVFFAITILHRQYIEELEAGVVDTPNAAQTAIFEQKKNEFFNNLKISYEEYMGYYEKNSAEMNRYIQNHPEIMEYLTIAK